MMRSIGIWLWAIVALQLSCLKPAKPPEQVEYEIGTIRFLKYLTSAQVQGEPQEVDYYLRDPGSIIATTAEAKVTPLSKKPFEKLGDRAEYRIELLGIKQNVVVTLIYHQPGEEIWHFIKQKNQMEGMSIFRLKLKKMGEGTRVNLSWDLQVGGVESLFPQLMGALNINETMADIIETGVANGQVHFNPDLKVEDLLAEGRRGELKDTFYQDNQYRVWINAPMDKVAKYLHDPKTWEIWKEKYYDFGKCLGKEWTGPCPLHFSLLGLIEIDASSFTVHYHYPDFSSTVWVFNNFNFVTLVQIILKPKSGGTEMTLGLIVEPPPSTSSPETMSLIMNLGKIQETITNMLLEVKTSLEGIG